MKELLSKLSSYNIFNYLLPGVVFVGISPIISGYSFAHENLLIAGFLYYFIGLVISRVGSLLVEPVLKKLGFLKFAEYKEFVVASKQDAKLEVLSEVNNTYRTLCSMFMLLLLLKLYASVAANVPTLRDWDAVVLFGALLIMFAFSYRKQTNYITKRIKANG